MALNADKPGERWVVDRLLPDQVLEDADGQRRGRLFLVAVLVLSGAAGFFAIAAYESEGSFGEVVFLLGAGSLICLLNIPLANMLGRLREVSILMCVEHVVIVWLCGLYGSGVGDASQWWLVPAPLVASVLLGPRAGGISAVAASCGMIFLHVAKTFSWLRFNSDDSQRDLFIMMASVTVFAAIAGLAMAFERSRERGQAGIDEALARLQVANEELSRVAAALTTARDQALADANRKDRFLGDMRLFSGTQTGALAQTRQSTERLADTIRAIAQSVDTLAESARGSSHAIDGVAEASALMQQSSRTLVGAVDEVGVSLGSLRTAVGSVQRGYGALRTQALETAGSMSAVEASAQHVREAAARTLSLSSGVIEDAVRGTQAVTRSAVGVNNIRDTALQLHDAMMALVARVERVDRILAVIDEVAIETNVLALNASIIAAQAGEHGLGFAVVADQIKGLAARVATSTRESAEVINEVKERGRGVGRALSEAVSAVDTGEALSSEAMLALEQIVRSATEATEMARAIEGRTVEQAERTTAVKTAMARVIEEVEAALHATADHARNTDRIAQAVTRLKMLAPDLEGRAGQQASGAKAVRDAISRVSAMAEALRDVQEEQKEASISAFGSVDELHRAQQGIDKALSNLR